MLKSSHTERCYCECYTLIVPKCFTLIFFKVTVKLLQATTPTGWPPALTTNFQVLKLSCKPVTLLTLPRPPLQWFWSPLITSEKTTLFFGQFAESIEEGAKNSIPLSDCLKHIVSFKSLAKQLGNNRLLDIWYVSGIRAH